MVSNKLIVIIPTYNESENIFELIDKLKKHNLDLLIVDDNSPDKTADIVRSASKEFPNIFLKERERKLGLGSAYRDGFREALNMGYEYFVEMDADFSHTVDDLDLMINSIQDADLVIGSRYVAGGQTIGWNKFRKLLSKSANIYSKILCGHNILDSTSGFRIYSSKALNAIKFEETKSDGYGFQIEMTYRAYKKGLKLKEVPITFHERREGNSKMNQKIIFEALFLVLRLSIKRFV